jgi:hypothetical protein
MNMMIICGLGICLTGLVVYSLCKTASVGEREMERLMINEIDRRQRINARLKELGFESYDWDISVIDDEVIQNILAEREEI